MALIVRPVVELNVPIVAPMAGVGVTVAAAPAQRVPVVGKLNVATGAAVMVTVLVAVAAAQPPEAATVLVTVYVPGIDAARLMAPVVALRLRPVVELNVPAVAPMASVTAGLVVPLTQKVDVGPKLNAAVGAAVMVTVVVAEEPAQPPAAATVLVTV
jgi:hypothetical protein